MVVVLFEQSKLQDFQTNKKLKREPSERQHVAKLKTDQTMFAEQITSHGCYLSKTKTYFYSCFPSLKSLIFLIIARFPISRWYLMNENYATLEPGKPIKSGGGALPYWVILGMCGHNG